MFANLAHWQYPNMPLNPIHYDEHISSLNISLDSTAMLDKYRNFGFSFGGRG